MTNMQKPVSQPTKKPNESGTLVISGMVKIHDPNSKQVFVETRA